MSLPAYHFHGSVTVILSKTAQNLLIKAAAENTNERERAGKKTGGRHEEEAGFFFVFFNLSSHYKQVRSIHRKRRAGETGRTSVTIRICSVYVA